jgi:hypothetical protein
MPGSPPTSPTQPRRSAAARTAAPCSSHSSATRPASTDSILPGRAADSKVSGPACLHQGQQILHHELVAAAARLTAHLARLDRDPVGALCGPSRRVKMIGTHALRPTPMIVFNT